MDPAARQRLFHRAAEDPGRSQSCGPVREALAVCTEDRRLISSRQLLSLRRWPFSCAYAGNCHSSIRSTAVLGVHVLFSSLSTTTTLLCLLYLIVPCCTLLYLTVLDCALLHLTVPYCALLHLLCGVFCILYYAFLDGPAFDCTLLYLTAPHCTLLCLHMTVPYCTLLHLTVPYCTLLYLTVPACALLHLTVPYCVLL